MSNEINLNELEARLAELADTITQIDDDSSRPIIKEMKNEVAALDSDISNADFRF